jgi:hypothetical protein
MWYKHQTMANALSPRPLPAGDPEGTSSSARSSRGTRLVIGLVLLGLAAAATGIWFQRQQTRRCLAFYGGPASRQISAASSVELWTLGPGSGPGRLRVLERRDVSQARGLVHLRRGLVEDANFLWHDAASPLEAAAVRLPDGAWDCALAFTDPAEPSVEATVIAFAFGGEETAGRQAAIAVVGQPGRIAMGRIEAGLQKWVTATLRDGGEGAGRSR